MKIRFASALLALTLPLCAQAPVAAEAETLFYKAFYMEKGQRDFVGAMDLYQQFLDKAPEHKLASEAAKQQFQLLDKTGKGKERDAFKAKYEKLLGNMAAAPAGGAAPAAGGARGGEGAGPAGPGGRGAGGAGAGRPDMAARVAELEKELAKAKEGGDAAKVKELETQLERAKAGRGQGGGAAGGRGGAMGALRGTKKISEMSDEELGQLKEGLGGMTRMLDMMRENGQEEVADKVEAAGTSL